MLPNIPSSWSIYHRVSWRINEYKKATDEECMVLIHKKAISHIGFTKKVYESVTERGRRGENL